MADIRLIAILPTAGVQAAPISQGSGSQPPVILTNLPVGSILSGFIINRDSSGNPILRTDKGDIAFASNFFLKIGSEVVIRIENQQGGTTAHILTVNGLPPEIAVQQSSFAGDPEIIFGGDLKTSAPNAPAAATQPSPAAAAPSPQAPVVSVSGVVVSSAPVAAPLPEGVLQAPQPALPAGTALTFHILSVATPEEAIPPEFFIAAPPTPQPAPAAPNPVLYAAYARAGGAPANPQPVAVAETPAQPQATQTLVANVIGKTAAGEAVLHTPAGIVRLETPTSWPVGSKVTLALPHMPTANIASAAAPVAAPLPELARQWESLRQIFTLLAARPDGGRPQEQPGLSLLTSANTGIPWSPFARADVPAAVTPQHISAGLMLFVAALRGGDFSNWLGKDNVKWLDAQGNGELVKKAEGEFALMARQFSAPPQPHQWQALFFPVAVEGAWQQLRLFVKRDRKEEKGQNPRESKDDHTRFVIEMSLSQMGEMQMDGFVRRQEKNLEFDLFIRSYTPLSGAMQQEIAAIYNHFGELTGYTGHLLFQAVKLFPVNPMEEVMAQAHGSVVA